MGWGFESLRRYQHHQRLFSIATIHRQSTAPRQAVAVIAVGCPVRRREWIIDRWFAHVEAAFETAGEAPVYVFVGPEDDPTVDRLRQLAKLRDRGILFGRTDETGPAPDRNYWGAERYVEMARLRNTLLGVVREIEPDYFLSLDSDILLHPQCVADLLQSASRFDAVGGGAYMMEWRALPNVAWHRPDHPALIRKEIEHVGVIPADIIMAVKLMSPAAYAVDYDESWTVWGEDIGWSLACRAAGVKIGWDNRHYNKHVLEPWMLDGVDERLGW